MILPYDRMNVRAIHEYNIIYIYWEFLKLFRFFINYTFITTPTHKNVNDNSQWQDLKAYT